MISKSILFLFLIFPLTLLAGEPIYKHIQQSNGLPSNEVFQVRQANNGFIWLACEKGLYRYDGMQYTLFRSEEMTMQAGSYIQEDDQHRIWYQTFHGALYYQQGDSIKRFGHKLYNASFIIQDSLLYAIAYHEGLVQINLHTNKVTPLHTSWAYDDYLISIPGGVGLFNYEPIPSYYEFGPIEKHHLVTEKQLNFLKIIYIGHQIYSLFTQANYIYLYQGSDDKKVLIQKFPFNNYINHCKIIDSSVYFLTKYGLIELNIKTGAVKHRLNGISTNDIYKDRNGYLWVSTGNEGIYQYHASHQGSQYPNLIGDAKITFLGEQAFLYNRNGEIFALNTLTDEINPVCTLSDHSRIYGIQEVDANFPMFHEVNLTVIQYQHKKYLVFTNGTKETAFVPPHYFAAALSGAGKLYTYSSDTQNVWYPLFKQFKQTQIQSKASTIDAANLIVGRTKSTTYDAENRTIYFASNLGLTAVTPNSFQEIKYQQASIYPEQLFFREKKLYILLGNGHLLEYSSNSHMHDLSTQFGLPPMSMMKAQNDFMILWNHEAIYLWDYSSNAPQKCKLPFGANEITDLSIRQDTFWISANKSLYKIKHTPYETKFFQLVTNIRHGSKVYESDKLVHIPFNERDIQIDFAILDYYDNIHRIEYCLNDQSWNTLPLSDRSLHLLSGAPGEYTMQFRINGVVQQSALHFILDKPWYKQIWFILLAGVLGSLLILLVYKVRMRKVIQAKLLLLEKDHMERDLRHSMLSSLKSQMNPHFIFNALNTIQSFIHNEEKQNAYIYLSKFSKLTRRILEMSDMPSITLREETETLVLYLEFEKMRFHDLQYSLTIDPNLDLDMTHLPSMIIQPYVENAIKHGLLHKKENKQLMLSCTKVNPQSLLIVIDDHGIGRARSMEINQSKRNKPNSFATQATAKRIALLKQDPKYKSIALEIIDKYDEQGEPTGTTVRIQLPIT